MDDELTNNTLLVPAIPAHTLSSEFTPHTYYCSVPERFAFTKGRAATPT